MRLADGTIIILDAGTGMRELGKVLVAEDRPHTLSLLLTHLHWDRIMGIPFFAPMWQRETLLRIYPLANDVQKRAVRERALFDGIHFPVRAREVPARVEFYEDEKEVWKIGSAEIRRIALNHPGGAQGFRIDADGSSLAYLTDNELSPPGSPETSVEALAKFASGVHLLIHDAQYEQSDMPAKRGWGHSTVDDVIRLSHLSGAHHLVLYHHDPERDDAALDALGVRANGLLRDRSAGTIAWVAREGLLLDTQA